MGALKKTRMYLGATTLLSLMFFAEVATAATMKWCTRWKVQYVDSGQGEDAFTSTGVVYLRARYSYGQVKNNGTGDTIWTGELDINGCTPALPISSFTTYKFRQATKAQRSSRRIYVNPDSGDWGTSYIWLNSYYTTGMLPFLYAGTHTFYPNWHTAKSNIMPIAGRVMRYYSTLDYPSSTYTYIRTDSSHCDSSGGAFYEGDGHICLLASGAPGWGDITEWKFITGHEIGHRIADRSDGPMLDGTNPYSGWPPPDDEKCLCDHTTYGSDLHCLGSRERINTAATEGWAHFFSAAIFNYRSSSTCGFGYAKEAFVEGETEPEDPPVEVDCTDNPQWMENNCYPDDGNYIDNDMGTEHDWLVFFWRLWTYGSYKFDMDEIKELWAITLGPSPDTDHWDELLDTVETEYGGSSGEYTHFSDTGTWAGVDHYYIFGS